MFNYFLLHLSVVLILWLVCVTPNHCMERVLQRCLWHGTHTDISEHTEGRRMLKVFACVHIKLFSWSFCMRLLNIQIRFANLGLVYSQAYRACMTDIWFSKLSKCFGTNSLNSSDAIFFKRIIYWVSVRTAIWFWYYVHIVSYLRKFPN